MDDVEMLKDYSSSRHKHFGDYPLDICKRFRHHIASIGGNDGQAIHCY